MFSVSMSVITRTWLRLLDIPCRYTPLSSVVVLGLETPVNNTATIK